MTAPKFNLPYDAPLRERLDCDLDNNPSLTVQSEKDGCDINYILNNLQKTGNLPSHARDPSSAKFIDVSNITDYQQSLNIVLEAERAFNNLPSEIRTRFNNNPAELIAFTENPQNQDEAVRLGLANPYPAEAPSSAPQNAGVDGATPAPTPRTEAH